MHSAGLVFGSFWRWTHVAGETKDCGIGSLWDLLCPDEATSSKQCIIEGADRDYKGTNGAKMKADILAPPFVTEGPYITHVRSRVYMMQNCYTGNLWDEKPCHDEATHSTQSDIEGIDKEYEGTFGVMTQADVLALQPIAEGPYTYHVEARLYRMRDEDTYKMIHLMNRDSPSPLMSRRGMWFERRHRIGMRSRIPRS